MRFLIKTLFWIHLLGVFASSAFAETTTLIAVSDNTLIEDSSGSRSNGSADAIYVGRTQRDGLRRGLIRFDVSTIPATATIQSASLKLLLFRGRPDESHLRVHRSLNSWGEGASNYFGGLGGQALTNDATWLHRFFGTSQLWANAGGDYLVQASATEVIEAPENVTHTISGAGLITDIQQWLTQPSNNFGWVLVADNDASAKGYASREHPNIALRPQLVVTWTPAAVASGSTDVPIPIWALAILGAALFFNLNRHQS
jgi:hypothetical protein